MNEKKEKNENESLKFVCNFPCKFHLQGIVF